MIKENALYTMQMNPISGIGNYILSLFYYVFIIRKQDILIFNL